MSSLVNGKINGDSLGARFGISGELYTEVAFEQQRTLVQMAMEKMPPQEQSYMFRPYDIAGHDHKYVRKTQESKLTLVSTTTTFDCRRRYPMQRSMPS
jgi:hypothetical protein